MPTRGKRKGRESFHNMETILQYIGKTYVKVDKGRIRSANPYLSRVLCKVTSALKRVSPLFRKLFETFLYAGSSYDGLKIGKPDEYDIDLKLYLPNILDVRLHPSDKDGFVHVELKDWDRLMKDKTLSSKFSELKDLTDDQHFLSQEKVKAWMQSIVDLAINDINDSGTFDDLKVRPTVSGPAVTLHVQKSATEIMSIDLVAVFRMPEEKWPAYPVRKNNSKIKTDFVVVPKPPKILDHMSGLKRHPERYWRLSFPEQEMELMNDYNFCKPVLRLIKKLRDTRSHNIPSYFIKTIFLWEIEKRNKQENKIFWRRSLTALFLDMLQIYKEYIEDKEIMYFWAKNNFLEPFSEINITNIRNSLLVMIHDIVRTKDTNPIMVAKYLLPTKEYEEVCTHFKIIA